MVIPVRIHFIIGFEEKRTPKLSLHWHHEAAAARAVASQLRAGVRELRRN
jgi:hypothetical protein